MGRRKERICLIFSFITSRVSKLQANMKKGAGKMAASNPYAASLDGLDLPNPVEAFFNFCRERENVRMRRERGDPAPFRA